MSRNGIGNTEKIIRDYASVYAFKERQWNVRVADFTKKPDNPLTEMSFAQQIYANQLVALGAYDNSDISLGRVLAFIILEGTWKLGVVIPEFVNWVIRGDKWGKTLWEEHYHFGCCGKEDTPSEEFKYASKSVATQVNWANSNGFHEAFELAGPMLAFLRKTRPLLKRPRAGWKQYHVGLRNYELDTNADHTVLAMFLAMAMRHTFKYKVDIEHVLLLLMVEHLTGDVPLYGKKSGEQISEEKKFSSLVSRLPAKDYLMKLFYENQKCETPEAKFARAVGRLETNFQAQAYSKLVNLDKQSDNPAMESDVIRGYLKNGDTFSEMWIHYSLDHYGFDANFRSVSEAMLDYDINRAMHDVGGLWK